MEALTEIKEQLVDTLELIEKQEAGSTWNKANSARIRVALGNIKHAVTPTRKELLAEDKK
jgi:hypothetical protein